MQKLTLCLVIVMLFAGSVFATLYPWPEEKRPPIALDKAFATAIKALQEKKGAHYPDYYCTQASLTGNKAQDGKEGAWNFKFRTGVKSGSDLYVTVYMNGKVIVGMDMNEALKTRKAMQANQE
jgi:hypothetical protein